MTLASDSSWGAYDGDPAANPAVNKLGAAQPVCLNATSPPSCPTGALLYGYAGVAWGLSLASIPGAEWIWGPGISPTDVPDLKQFYFSRRFNLGTGPSGTSSIAADDKARVVVNGVDGVGVGSISDETLRGPPASQRSTSRRRCTRAPTPSPFSPRTARPASVHARPAAPTP